MRTRSDAPTPPRVLLLFVGNRRNAPELGRNRPALRVALEVSPVEHAFLLHTEGDPTGEAHAEALKRDLSAPTRAPAKVSVRAIAAGAPAEPHSRDALRGALSDFVAHLEHVAFGARFASREFVVSLATGTLAQCAGLIDSLDARGARVAVAWETLSNDVSVWRPEMAVHDLEPEVARLCRAPGAWNVLLTGPTGAGKSVLARRLHDAWAADLKRVDTFQPVNAAAIPSELIESTLFGHVKGAFTGATASAKGLLKSADGGTLFLDEIGELPLALQSKLLTVLDVDPRTRRRAVRPVGAASSDSTDIRLILGTNQDLHAMARAGRFRLDLLARVSTHHIRLPPLREARHRIVPTCAAHLEDLGALYAQTGHPEVRFSLDGEARRSLLDFMFSPTSTWRWNHRDVLQCVERLCLRAWSPPTREGKRGLRTVMISRAAVDAERRELEARWSALGDEDPSVGDGWAPVAERVKPDVWEALSRVERWELRYLVEALDAAGGSHADAWRWIVERNLVPGARAQAKNASNAFAKRWRRYAHALRG